MRATVEGSIRTVVLPLVALASLADGLWQPASGQTATDLRLPFEGHAAGTLPAFTIVSEGGPAIVATGNLGLLGRSSAASGTGVEGHGKGEKGSGVAGVSADRAGDGVTGIGKIGVRGTSEDAGGKGVAGKAEGGKNAVGVYGQSTSGMAGFFRGKVTITESLITKEIFVDKITAAKGLIGGAKLFQIDHPLDPAGKFLSHASVESPEMKNIYDGIITLDADGAGWVTLPEWFQALNKEFRYQLTCIGGFASVYVAQEIANNRFRIAGGQPGLMVSWQVTGVRRDAYAKAHPLRVEQEKSPAEKGKFLNPVELGFPESAGIHYYRDGIAKLDPTAWEGVPEATEGPSKLVVAR